MQELRKLLWPFSLLYGLVVWARNKFFDKGLLQSQAYDFQVICVGNLSVGGTGKTPMIEYLIRLLKDEFRVATLSRGYKRETTGFYHLTGNENVAQSGDEPLQFKTKFPEITVAVDENRQEGIAELRKLNPQPEVILLDDAFQHRKVTPGFSILLTAYGAIYSDDLLLPAGNLRESRAGAKRAQIVVVTKCPQDLSIAKQNDIRQRLKLQPDQQLFFSYIAYASKIINKREEFLLADLQQPFCLVTGIAKPKPLVEHLKSLNLQFKHQAYPDHHNFTTKELQELSTEPLILTTEKDYMRLAPHFSKDKLFYIPIKQAFISNQSAFDVAIVEWVKKQL